MQAISRHASPALQPRVYRNRPSPPPLVPYRSDDEFDTVYVVDADPEVRANISAYLIACGNVVVECASAAEYLSPDGTDFAACVILNIGLRDLTAWTCKGGSLKMAIHP
jgi:hypothetical protein